MARKRSHKSGSRWYTVQPSRRDLVIDDAAEARFVGVDDAAQILVEVPG